MATKEVKKEEKRKYQIRVEVEYIEPFVFLSIISRYRPWWKLASSTEYDGIFCCEVMVSSKYFVPGYVTTTCYGHTSTIASSQSFYAWK